MRTRRLALQLGLRLVQCKLGQAVGDPGFAAFAPEELQHADQAERLPVSDQQTKDTSAKIQPPRVITTRSSDA